MIHEWNRNSLSSGFHCFLGDIRQSGVHSKIFQLSCTISRMGGL